MCGQHQQQVLKAAWKQVHELEVEPFSWKLDTVIQINDSHIKYLPEPGTQIADVNAYGNME